MNFLKAEEDFPDYLLGEHQQQSPENIALFKATLAGSLTGVKDALKKGGKPNFFYKPEEQKNSLHIAVENLFHDIVDILIENNAAIDSKVGTSQSTSIILAAEVNNIKSIEKLIQCGANINATNGYGNSALHIAARNGNNDVVSLLLKHNAIVNIQNKKGSIALHFACYSETSSDHIVNELLKAGADIEMKDNRGLTPLLAICKTGHVSVLNLLLAKGANPLAIDNTNANAVSICEFHNHAALKKILLDSPTQRFH